MTHNTVAVTVPAAVAPFFRNISQTPAIRLRDVASMVGLHPRTLRRAVAAGELPAFRLGRRNGSGDWAVTPADAADFVCRVFQLPPMPPLDLSVNAAPADAAE